MGGSAFPDISTPRIPATTYLPFKEHIQSILKKHYRLVETPIEGPGKADYGDLDVLVAEPIQPDPTIKVDNDSPLPPIALRVEDVSMILGARFYKCQGDTMNFAVPWPEDQPFTGRARASSTTSTTSNRSGRHMLTPPPPEDLFIQVDVHVLPDSKSWNWLQFLHAHGDLWSILGQICRRFGFTATVHGFYILIPEIEGQNKNMSRVKASDDPSKVLAFLGLDESRYWTSFSSWEDLMDYAATCRFHDPGRGRKKGVDEASFTRSSSKSGDVDHHNASTTSLTKEVGKLDLELKANDRQRASKRPMFAHWLNVYRPAHTDDPADSASQLSKTESIEDGKSFFGPVFARYYEERRAEGIRVVGQANLWAKLSMFLRAEATESSDITFAKKGIKAGISGGATEEEGGWPGLRRAYDEGRYDDVLSWAKANWREVADKQRALDEGQSKAKYAEKMAKESAASRVSDDVAAGVGSEVKTASRRADEGKVADN